MDGDASLDASQRKASGLVLLVLENGHTAVLQDAVARLHFGVTEKLPGERTRVSRQRKKNKCLPDASEAIRGGEIQRAGSPTGTRSGPAPLWPPPPWGTPAQPHHTY